MSYKDPKLNDFQNGTCEFLNNAYLRLEAKGKEYAPGKSRFDEIRDQARLNGMLPSDIIKVLASKHITMLFKTGRMISAEEFDERAIDIVAYLCIWYNLIHENDVGDFYGRCDACENVENCDCCGSSSEDDIIEYADEHENKDVPVYPSLDNYS